MAEAGAAPTPNPYATHQWGRAVGWIEAEVNDWLKQQIEASRTGT